MTRQEGKDDVKGGDAATAGGKVEKVGVSIRGEAIVGRFGELLG